MSVIESILSLDKSIFSFIQTKLTASWLDGIMITLRTPYTWIPLYIFMLYWILRFDKTICLKFVLVTVACFALTDYSTSHFLKPFFERLRPCYDTDMQSCVRGIVGCGGKYSFPSSHAANHFGLASFWFFSISYIKNKKWRWLWLWAALVCFAQVYVGVHFPVDVIAGAIIGFFCGFGLFLLFKRWTKYFLRTSPDKTSLSLHSVNAQ